MGFRMNGSPAKLGTIQGTSGHASALKMKAEEELAKARAKRMEAEKTASEKQRMAEMKAKFEQKEKAEGKQMKPKPENWKRDLKPMKTKNPKEKAMGDSPAPFIGKIAKGVGKVVGKVKGAVDKVAGAYKAGKEEGSSPATLKTGGKTAPDREKRPHLYKDSGKKALEEAWKGEKYTGKRSKGGLKKHDPSKTPKSRVSSKKALKMMKNPKTKEDTPNKWLLTAGKAILGGIKKKNQKDDARAAAKNQGVQSMQQV